MPIENKQRIAKVIAAAGICSRRDAERYITVGRVTVNGKVIDTPATLVDEKDAIKVDGVLLKNTSQTPRIWLYHKPVGLVVSHKDEKGRDTVFDHLPKSLPRVISVGRLDLNSEGLLLLTNSGELARALELPKNRLPRRYRVRVRGTPTERNIRLLERGITIDGIKYEPVQISPEPAKEGRNQWLLVTLHEGKNREIRKLFEHFDLPVSRLIRTEYGPFALKQLKLGDVKEVPTKEINDLIRKLNIA